MLIKMQCREKETMSLNGIGKHMIGRKGSYPKITKKMKSYKISTLKGRSRKWMSK